MQFPQSRKEPRAVTEPPFGSQPRAADCRHSHLHTWAGHRGLKFGTTCSSKLIGLPVLYFSPIPLLSASKQRSFLAQCPGHCFFLTSNDLPSVLCPQDVHSPSPGRSSSLLYSSSPDDLLWCLWSTLVATDTKSFQVFSYYQSSFKLLGGELLEGRGMSCLSQYSTRPGL